MTGRCGGAGMRRAAAAFCLAAGVAAAQGGPPGVAVSAGGVVPVEPAALQFTFQIKAEGPDVAAAAAALDAKRGEITAKLKGLGVAEGGVKAGTPGLQGAGNAQQEQIAHVLRSNRLKKSAPAADAAAGPATVTAAQSLTARLPLTARKGAALFVETEQLKAKVKGAGLLDPRKEEEGEEDDEQAQLRRMMERYQTDEAAKDEGGFLFVYYAPADPKAGSEAMEKAMASARAQAEAAAKAAGKTLGGLVLLKVTEGNEQAALLREYRWGWQDRSETGDPGEGALVSPNPEGLRASVFVEATYALQ